MNLKGGMFSCKKLILKGYIVYDSIYMTFSKRQEYRDRE